MAQLHQRDRVSSMRNASCSAMKALQKCKAFVVLRADTAVCRQPPENTDSTSVLSTMQSLVGESCFLKLRLKAPGVRTAKNHLGQQYALPWRESSLALGNTVCKQIPQMSTVREKHFSGAHPWLGIADTRRTAPAVPHLLTYLLPAAPASRRCSHQTSASPHPRRRRSVRPTRSAHSCRGSRHTSCSPHHRRSPASTLWNGPELSGQRRGVESRGSRTAPSPLLPALT